MNDKGPARAQRRREAEGPSPRARALGRGAEATSTATHLLDALLSGDRLPGALPGPARSSGYAGREPAAPCGGAAPGSSRSHGAGRCSVGPAVQLPLDDILIVQQRGELGQLVLGEVFAPAFPGDPGLAHNRSARNGPMP